MSTHTEDKFHYYWLRISDSQLVWLACRFLSIKMPQISNALENEGLFGVIKHNFVNSVNYYYPIMF